MEYILGISIGFIIFGLPAAALNVYFWNSWAKKPDDAIWWGLGTLIGHLLAGFFFTIPITLVSYLLASKEKERLAKIYANIQKTNLSNQ